jgi:guanyl-specific ribonuclease Sa
MNRNARLLGWVLVALLVVLVGRNWLPGELTGTTTPTASVGTAAPASAGMPALARLPAEEQQAIRATLALIAAGGPFRHRQDGTEFQNREGRLPDEASGYYREYTVVTPDSPDRGARRLVAGRNGEIYYTDDHYRSFLRLD